MQIVIQFGLGMLKLSIRFLLNKHLQNAQIYFNA